MVNGIEIHLQVTLMMDTKAFDKLTPKEIEHDITFAIMRGIKDRTFSKNVSDVNVKFTGAGTGTEPKGG